MTVTQSVDARLARVFATLDTDADGLIAWPDLQSLVDRYLLIFEVDPHALPALALRVAYEMEWVEFRRHSNGAERLDADAFAAAVVAASADTSRFDVLSGVPEAIADVMDGDGDGRITREEFGRFLDVWRIPQSPGLDVFGALDADGDGLISRAAFLRSVRDFHDPGETAATSRYYQS